MATESLSALATSRHDCECVLLKDETSTRSLLAMHELEKRFVLNIAENEKLARIDFLAPPEGTFKDGALG